MDRIQKEIEKRAREKAESLTDEELFTSPEFKNLISDKVASMTNEPIVIVILLEAPGNTAGCTDGKTLYLGYNNRLIQYYANQTARYLCANGTVFHEMGHILFFDFKKSRELMALVSNGQWPGAEPIAPDAVVLEIEEGLKNPGYRKIIEEVYSHTENAVIDPHDEKLMIEKYGAYVERCLAFPKESIRSRVRPLELLEESASSKLQVLFSLILQIARFGEIFCMSKDYYESSEYVKAVMSVKEHIDNARMTDSCEERFNELSYIVAALWPFIKEEVSNNQQKQQSNGQENQENDQGNGNGQAGNGDQESQSGDGGNDSENQPEGSKGQSGGQERSNSQPGQLPPLTEEQIEEILKSLEKAAKENGETSMPRGRATSKENHSGNQKNRYSAQQSSKPDQNAVTRDEDIRTIQRLKEQIASKQVEEQMEKQAKIEYDKEFFEMDPESIHQLVPVNFIRHLDYSQNDVALYNRTMQDMFSVSRRMQRSIKDALRDLEEGDADRFLHFGRLIDTRAAYRLDGRCFMNRFVPSDMPEMAISILVDMSWSMSRDGRDIHSRKAAMMLYDFGQGLHIPVNVAGHTTTGIGVDYHIFSDFDNISGNDKFRMAQIKHGESVFCCNRDGLAIDITANHLAKRPEEIKLLFIICDGRPNHRGYSGEVACEDIQNIVKKYRKKGIEMIACAIGDDKDLIREIYQEAYLDITDLQTMPKTLVNLVKRKLMTFGY